MKSQVDVAERLFVFGSPLHLLFRPDPFLEFLVLLGELVEQILVNFYDPLGFEDVTAKLNVFLLPFC